jgi:hypothetical protein
MIVLVVTVCSVAMRPLDLRVDKIILIVFLKPVHLICQSEKELFVERSLVDEVVSPPGISTRTTFAINEGAKVSLEVIRDVIHSRNEPSRRARLRLI